MAEKLLMLALGAIFGAACLYLATSRAPKRPAPTEPNPWDFRFW